MLYIRTQQHILNEIKNLKKQTRYKNSPAGQHGSYTNLIRDVPAIILEKEFLLFLKLLDILRGATASLTALT